MEYEYSNRKSNHYVSAKELYNEWVHCVEQNKCTDKMLMYFRRMAKHISTRFEYVNKADTDAVVEYALGEIWQKWDKFDPEKTTNIFSYYTTLLINDMMLHYKQLNKGKSLQISIEALFTPKDR